jgi:hypothetical protein
MAKSDLLKEAIADAQAVKETAIANAKLALQEAFAPRIQSMLSAKLSEQLEDEDEMEMPEDEMDMDAEMGDMDAEMGDMDAEMGTGSIGVAVDVDGDGKYDYEGELGNEMDAEMDMDAEMGDLDAAPEDMDAEYDEAELDLDEIIRELEEGMYSEEEDMHNEGSYNEEAEEENIDEIIESILAAESTETKSNVSKLQSELNEAYSTINQLRSVINEVNLLNAKLLYTNKLFRNFELEETQKMKVIENFDRASNTREVKLVFSTLAESFKKPAGKKRVVKESYASKPARTTAPSKQVTQQILSEGSDLAARWKKLAGLL